MNNISEKKFVEEPVLLLTKSLKNVNKLLKPIAIYHNIPLDMIRGIYYKLDNLRLKDEIEVCLFKLLSPKILYEISVNNDNQYIAWLTKTRLMVYNILGQVSTLIDLKKLNINNLRILNETTIRDLSNLDEFDYEYLYKSITGHSSHYAIQSRQEFLKLFTVYNIINTLYNIIRIFDGKNLNNIALKWSKITQNFIDINVAKKK